MVATIKKPEWSKGQIRDGCIVGDGAHAKINRQDKGVAYLTSKNFKGEGLDLSKLDYISEADFAKHFKDNSQALTKLRAGDVLLGIIGSIGAPYLVTSKDLFGISSSVAILRPNQTNLMPLYLYYWIKGYIFQDALYGIKGGVAQSYVSLDMIKSLPLNYPSLPIQRKIAAILSAYDALIENNQRRIRLLEEMAAAVYHEWFVHFRFPGHEAVRIVDGMPEGWRQTQLVNVADVNASSIGKTYEADTINYVDIASVSTGHIDAIQPITFADAPSRARRIVRHGDIIWSTVRPNRKSYSLILNPIPDLIVSTGFAVISAKQAPYSYLYFALTTDDFATYLTNRATGAAYPAVNSGDFERAEVLLPDKSILDAFDSVVADMLDLKHNLSQKNASLRQTRDLLLPKLISGDLDVEHLDINTEALDE